MNDKMRLRIFNVSFNMAYLERGCPATKRLYLVDKTSDDGWVTEEKTKRVVAENLEKKRRIPIENVPPPPQE